MPFPFFLPFCSDVVPLDHFGSWVYAELFRCSETTRYILVESQTSKISVQRNSACIVSLFRNTDVVLLDLFGSWVYAELFQCSEITGYPSRITNIDLKFQYKRNSACIVYNLHDLVTPTLSLYFKHNLSEFLKRCQAHCGNA
jgi:hypothetical protein